MYRLEQLLNRLQTWPRWQVFALLAAFTLAVGYADWASDDRLALSVLYFPLVALCCWLVGFVPAVTLSLVASSLWVIDDLFVPHHPLPNALKIWHCVARFFVFAAFAWVLSRLHTILQREQRLSHFDDLTGLANRASLFEFGQRDVARCRRAGRPLTAIFIDLDEFKQVNDRQGHAEGDRVLRAVAECIKNNTRLTDLTARLGGDEFVVLAPEMDVEVARRYTSRLQACLDEAVSLGDWGVTFSIGAAVYQHVPGSLDEIVKAADDLMYEVKRRHKNGVRLRQVDAQAQSEEQADKMALVDC